MSKQVFKVQCESQDHTRAVSGHPDVYHVAAEDRDTVLEAFKQQGRNVQIIYKLGELLEIEAAEAVEHKPIKKKKKKKLAVKKRRS